jgi:4-alpha-glucanotransferase
MKILQYAFGGSAANDHLPHNQSPNTVIYTGTHDNDAMLGWYRAAGQRERAFARRYAGLPNPAGVAWSFVRLAWSSPARLAVVPLQDVLGLGSRSRMNHPGTTSGNWTWRMPPGALTPALAARLRTLSRTFGR